MGFFDTLADVSTVASPGLEAYGKGRLAEATTVGTLRNQLINNLVRRAKFSFDIEKQGSLEAYRESRLAQGERGLQVREAKPPTSVKEQILGKVARGEPLTPGEAQALTLIDPFGEYNLPYLESGTATAGERIPPRGGGGFLSKPPPTPAPGIYQRGVDLIGSEAIPGPTAGDVISWIQSRLTPKYETQAPVTSKQSVQALREGILARGGSEEDVGTIFKAMRGRKIDFNRVVNLFNKGVPVSEILTAREFKTAHHSR